MLAGNSSEPSGAFAAITKSDTVDLPAGLCRFVYVGGAGNLAVLSQDSDTPVVFTGALVGTILPIRIRRLMSTNTTATLCVAMY